MVHSSNDSKPVEVRLYSSDERKSLNRSVRNMAVAIDTKPTIIMRLVNSKFNTIDKWYIYGMKSLNIKKYG